MMGRPLLRIVYLVIFATSAALTPFAMYALIVSLPSLHYMGIGLAGLVITMTTFPAAVMLLSLFVLTHRRRRPQGFPVQQQSHIHSNQHPALDCGQPSQPPAGLTYNE